jgi:hypothetical protein
LKTIRDALPFLKAKKEKFHQKKQRGIKNDFMIRGICRVRLPNPHQTDISVDLLRRILKEAGITREEWLRVDD